MFFLFMASAIFAWPLLGYTQELQAEKTEEEEKMNAMDGEVYDDSMTVPVAHQVSDKADLLDKIKPDAIVEVIRQRLLGKELVNGTWVTNPELESRALTPVGAWDIANLMLGVSSQNVAISKLNDLEIKNRSLNIAKTAQYMCLKNWKEYGIKGKDQLYFVHQIVFSVKL